MYRGISVTGMVVYWCIGLVAYWVGMCDAISLLCPAQPGCLALIRLSDTCTNAHQATLPLCSTTFPLIRLSDNCTNTHCTTLCHFTKLSLLFDRRVLREAPLKFVLGAFGHCPNSFCTTPPHSNWHSGALHLRKKCPKPSGQGSRPPQNQANSSQKSCPKPSGRLVIKCRFKVLLSCLANRSMTL